jgi:hypothetical protein
MAFASGGALFVATPDILRSGPELGTHLKAHGITVFR